VVLVWYPKDFTFVCPTEIIAFSDRAAEFEALGAQIIVASTDTAEVHGAWTRVPRSAGGLGAIGVPMLADTTKVSERTGVESGGAFSRVGNARLGRCPLGATRAWGGVNHRPGGRGERKARSKTTSYPSTFSPFISHLSAPPLSFFQAIASTYGVLDETLGIALRGTYIIDAAGVLQHASVNALGVGRSVDEVLRTLAAIQYVAEHGEVCPAGWQPGEATIDTGRAGDYFATVPDASGGADAAPYATSLRTVSTAADLDAATASAPAALVFVAASWCGKCRQVAPLVERLAAEAGPERLAVVKVDASQPGGLAEDALGVAKGSPLPAFRLYKGGRSVGALAGYKPSLLKEEVEKLLV